MQQIGQDDNHDHSKTHHASTAVGTSTGSTTIGAGCSDDQVKTGSTSIGLASTTGSTDSLDKSSSDR